MTDLETKHVNPISSRTANVNTILPIYAYAATTTLVVVLAQKHCHGVEHLYTLVARVTYVQTIRRIQN